MDSGAVAYNSLNNDEPVKLTYRRRLLYENSRISKLFEDIPENAREDFFNYLAEQGLVSETGMLVIPSHRHFFYDAEDMKKIKTVVNLRQLNHIREMKEFLRTVADMLPQRSNFIGCFVDNKAQSGFSDKYNNQSGQMEENSEVYENGIESRIPFINRMYSIIDARTNRYLTRRSVTNLLKEYGLQVIGMTDLHGITYFCTQKSQSVA
jgi:hypothetical protein